MVDERSPKALFCKFTKTHKLSALTKKKIISMSGHGVFTDTEQGKWQGQFQAGHGEALTAVLEAAF